MLIRREISWTFQKYPTFGYSPLLVPSMACQTQKGVLFETPCIFLMTEVYLEIWILGYQRSIMSSLMRSHCDQGLNLEKAIKTMMLCQKSSIDWHHLIFKHLLSSFSWNDLVTKAYLPLTWKERSFCHYTVKDIPAYTPSSRSPYS